MRTWPFIACLVLGTAGCSSFDCNATTCAQGCCSGGSCYEGAGLTGGVSCDTALGGGVGGSGGSGGGTGGGSSTGGGTGGGAQCGDYDSPCNESLPCCVSSESNTLTDFCNADTERCALCGTSNYDCSDDMNICCPGLDCLLKPGFTQIYECQ